MSSKYCSSPVDLSNCFSISTQNVLACSFCLRVLSVSSSSLDLMPILDSVTYLCTGLTVRLRASAICSIDKLSILSLINSCSSSPSCPRLRGGFLEAHIHVLSI